MAAECDGDLTAAQTRLAWLLARSPVTVVIAGTGSVEPWRRTSRPRWGGLVGERGPVPTGWLLLKDS